jgi:hypothetical protein
MTKSPTNKKKVNEVYADGSPFNKSDGGKRRRRRAQRAVDAGGPLNAKVFKLRIYDGPVASMGKWTKHAIYKGHELYIGPSKDATYYLGIIDDEIVAQIDWESNGAREAMGKLIQMLVTNVDKKESNVNESKKTIKEGVLDDMDDDGFMAKRQLYDLAKYAVELHRMIQDTDNLEPWVQAKITKAADYISTVKHYLEYQGVRGAEGTADQMGADDMADIDDMDAQVVATGEVLPLEPLMADADPTIVEEETLDGMDILRMAKSRGIISQQQYEDPEPILLDMAQGMADMLSPEDVAGSSDVSILMKEFVATAEAELVLLLGPKVDAYYSMTEAKRIYERMMRNVKGKK